MATRTAFTSHEAYLAQVPSAVQPLLRDIQATVERLIPQATPVISYGMPAYRLQRTFFYFAAFKHHIGVYPPVNEGADLLRLLAPYRNDKGNLRFPLSQPLPLDLIGRVAEALARQYAKS